MTKKSTMLPQGHIDAYNKAIRTLPALAIVDNMQAVADFNTFYRCDRKGSIPRHVTAKCIRHTTVGHLTDCGLTDEQMLAIRPFIFDQQKHF